MTKPKIKISSNVNAALLKVWQLWTSPSHIVNWNYASPDWHTPRATIDLRLGGKFSSRMEAKDGSVGFDFEGIITEVVPLQKLSYKMADDREATITFQGIENGTMVSEEFDAEDQNSLELQEMGWQAILDNFKSYTESYKGLDLHPCIWYNRNGKEAAELYCNAIKPSGIITSTSITSIFQLKGNKFMALNGGPNFVVNPSISFMVIFDDDDALRYAWDQLIADGSVLMKLDSYSWSSKYGWCQDRYGVSWQLIKLSYPNTGHQITPCLMFTNEMAGKAEEAILHYTSIFPHSQIFGINRYQSGENDVKGTIKHAMFSLSDTVFSALDSSAENTYSFNEGVSIVIPCDTQYQIDYYWSKLTDGGEESMCGWLKDKYGISWQVVPTILNKLLSDPDKSPRVVKAFLKMKKFDIETLVKA